MNPAPTMGRSNPTNQYMTAAATVPAVPGATGKWPTNPAVAMILSALVSCLAIQHLRKPRFGRISDWTAITSASP
jgi:hypothetical protein